MQTIVIILPQHPLPPQKKKETIRKMKCSIEYNLLCGQLSYLKYTVGQIKLIFEWYF